jgi:hypothetical protein
MATRAAACHCGQLQLEVTGQPSAVSICHCLDCQRRTGSAFGMQAGFKADQVSVTGRYHDFMRISDESDRKAHVFHFCPDCGSQVFYTEPDEPDLIGVSGGSACCESLAGRTSDALEHLRLVIDMWEGAREMAKQDSDFDPIRDDRAFRELVGP